MTIKERLRNYRYLVLYIKQLEDDINDLYVKAETMTLQADKLGIKVQEDTQPDPIGEIVSEIADMAIELGEKLSKAKEERKAIDDLLEFLPAQDRLLISLRYIQGRSWEQVAVDMQYSIYWVWSRHGDILQKLEK